VFTELEIISIQEPIWSFSFNNIGNTYNFNGLNFCLYYRLHSCVALCPYRGTNWTDRSDTEKSHSHYGHAVHVYVNWSKSDYFGLSQRGNFKEIFFYIFEKKFCLHHLLPDPLSLLYLDPIWNILEFTLVPNVTAPLFIMCQISIRIVCQTLRSWNWQSLSFSVTNIYFCVGIGSLYLSLKLKFKTLVELVQDQKISLRFN